MKLKTNLHAGQLGGLGGRFDMCAGLAEQIDVYLNMDLSPIDLIKLQSMLDKYNMICANPGLQH